jgi:hypothetical protein
MPKKSSEDLEAEHRQLHERLKENPDDKALQQESARVAREIVENEKGK